MTDTTKANSINPLVAATDDLSRRWDMLIQDNDELHATNASLTTENVALRAEKKRLEDELASKEKFFEFEIERMTARADKAIEEHVDMRARVDLVAKTLQMVLSETMTIKAPPVAVDDAPKITPVVKADRADMTNEVEAALNDPAPPPPPAPEFLMARPVEKPRTDPADVAEDVENAESAAQLIGRLAPVSMSKQTAA